MSVINRSLHWNQRIALNRHNLHTASRVGDFTFSKHLQAQGFVDGTNHVAILSTTLGDEAGILLTALDDFNAGLAQVHEDAFRRVYDGLRTCLEDKTVDVNADAECRSKLYVDITMQKQMAEMVKQYIRY